MNNSLGNTSETGYDSDFEAGDQMHVDDVAKLQTQTITKTRKKMKPKIRVEFNRGRNKNDKDEISDYINCR